MISERTRNASESITLKLNATAQQLKSSGKEIYNLTAGQLPFLPDEQLLGCLSHKLGEVGTYQYSPVPGLLPLREKFMSYVGEDETYEFGS